MMAQERPTRTSRAAFGLIRRPDPDRPTERQLLLRWNERWQTMSLIGGHLEQSDPNYLACAIRELHEELFGALAPPERDAMRAAVTPDPGDYDQTRCRWQDPFLRRLVRSTDPPHEYPDFIDYSASKQQWTRYTFRFYDVELTEVGADVIRTQLADGDTAAREHLALEWVSRQNVARGATHGGRSISPAVGRVFGPQAG